MRIFREFSPMSPERIQAGEMSMDEFLVYMELDLQWREERIAQLECSTQEEMKKLEVILQAKDRSASRSRKRKHEECFTCKEDFKNACLNCKERFSSKKLKLKHEEITVHKEEIEKIKNEYKNRLEARQAQIAAEAQQKEAEARQAQNGQIKEENQSSEEDYSTSSSSQSNDSDSNDDVKEEADVKVEPEEQNGGFIGTIGMQVKSEPMSPASSEESESSMSSSDEDMDEEPANEEPANGQQADDQPAFILPQAERFVLEGRYGRGFTDGELFN